MHSVTWFFPFVSELKLYLNHWDSTTHVYSTHCCVAVFANPQETHAFFNSFTRNSLNHFKKTFKRSIYWKIISAVSYKTHLSKYAESKEWLFHSKNKKLPVLFTKSAATKFWVSVMYAQIPTQLTEATLHHCNLQNECTLMWRNIDFKKQLSTWQAYQKDLQVLTKFYYKEQQVIDEPKKDTKLFIQSPATDLSSDQATVLPLNALQWRVCFSTAQITHYKLMLTGTLQYAERKETPWQKKSIPAIASFALEPTQDPTSTAKSSSVVLYYASHLFVLLTYKSFALVLQWNN